MGKKCRKPPTYIQANYMHIHTHCGKENKKMNEWMYGWNEMKRKANLGNEVVK